MLSAVTAVVVTAARMTATEAAVAKVKRKKKNGGFGSRFRLLNILNRSIFRFNSYIINFNLYINDKMLKGCIIFPTQKREGYPI